LKLTKCSAPYCSGPRTFFSENTRAFCSATLRPIFFRKPVTDY
jgi:hypothetical protein